MTQAPGFLLAVAAMAVVVLASNILVQYAINDWLTWGAFTYPVAFLVSELVNRRFGPRLARRVAWVGFAVAVPTGHPEVQHRVHYVTKAGGGRGAVREVCDLVMRAQGTYEQALAKYFA